MPQNWWRKSMMTIWTWLTGSAQRPTWWYRREKPAVKKNLRGKEAANSCPKIKGLLPLNLITAKNPRRRWKLPSWKKPRVSRNRRIWKKNLMTAKSSIRSSRSSPNSSSISTCNIRVRKRKPRKMTFWFRKKSRCLNRKIDSRFLKSQVVYRVKLWNRRRKAMKKVISPWRLRVRGIWTPITPKEKQAEFQDLEWAPSPTPIQKAKSSETTPKTICSNFRYLLRKAALK